MFTITGKLEDATGAALHAALDFKSQSTPIVTTAGLVVTTTDARILSNPEDGTFSVDLYAGNYLVTITANGQTSIFNIAVPDGDGTASIETLVSTPLAYVFTPPNTVWNGTRPGHITFLPTAPPPAPGTSEVAYAGGGVDNGGDHYSYFISYVTVTGETVVSPAAAVGYNSGTAVPNMATRLALVVNPAGVTLVRIWRTYVDNGHSYDTSQFPNNVGLLATCSPASAYYDDWESTTEFAARVDHTIIPPLINTTAGELLADNGEICAQITPQGLIVPSTLTQQGPVVFPGAPCRFTPGVGFELYNFTTQLWHTLIATGNPATLGLSSGHA